MRLWVDVLNASGDKLGAGPIIAAQSATINRVLDGVGGWTLSLSAADERHIDLLVEGRYVNIYAETAGVSRLIGGGLITDRSISDSASGPLMKVRGPDQLESLKNYSTLLGRQYNNAAISSVVASLAALAGWSATVDAGLGNTTQVFDGASVLKALQTIASAHGQHLRLSSTANTIDFGAMGTDTGLRLVQRQTVTYELDKNPDVALIDSISEKRSQGTVVNWLLPLGKKGQAPRVTLQYSTRTSPYTIQSMVGPDGSTLYYLSDAASVTTYGTRQAVKAWDKIGAASGGAADLEAAANALYDAAATELARSADLTASYSLGLRGVNRVLLPGDKVRVVYQGRVNRDGEQSSYLSTDALYWILSVSETMGSEGHSVSIEARSVDRVEADSAEQVADAVVKVNEMEI